MGILNKIWTAIRGGAREAGEAVVDANGIRIFEQEIVDAENNLHKAKQELTTIMAQEMQVGRQIDELANKITTHEEYAAQAIAKNEEELALEVANKIAVFIEEQEQLTATRQKYTNHVEKLKAVIKQTSASIADMRRQLSMVKATDKVQKASKAINSNSLASGSKLLDAKASLDRIQKKQQTLEDQMNAGNMLDADFSNKGLEEKLKAAGIGKTSSNADAILAKIKAKKNS